jgi:S-DNA-T family DNA segregation ATPase FtsK/SpoIIIE
MPGWDDWNCYRMADSASIKTVAQPRGGIGAQNARHRFVPSQRDPLRLPEDKVEIPAPPPPPPPPASVNLITTILPPVIMLAGTLIVSLFTGTGSLTYMIPMFVMSLGFPLANVIGLFSQKKNHRTAVEQREQTYQKTLNDECKKLDSLVLQQQSALEETYPNLKELEKIASTRGKLLWTRRPADDDFLSLRIGSGEGKPSFSVEDPRVSDPNDPLLARGLEITKGYQKIPSLPSLVPLARVGSVAITGPSSASVYNLTRRLVLDILVHHSPQDVHLAVLGDTREAIEHWEWLKWLPHTDSLGLEKKLYHLAFDSYKIDKLLEFLVTEFHNRSGQGEDNESPKGRKREQPAFVVLVDDSGQVRQRSDIPLLAEWGNAAKIFLIFVGGRDWPRECRARIDVLDDQKFKFTETWTKGGELSTGAYEKAASSDCDLVARALAGWEVAGSQSHAPLPESVRLSQVLGSENLSVDGVKQSWSADFEPKSLLHFPIGICARRDQLELAMINLLPAERGGNDAYHTILIGTTGSGKSEFMKSLVMGAALRYPPNLLNFFFLDFKGGAAFSIFEDLPHVSGVVTNLRPELVERGLDSIKNEIERRQEEFSKIKVQNIWDYNRQQAERPLPHLVLFLDEFARGLADFPRLRETLDVLVRQGRSLGMYLILANQDVNSEVDKLLNNVGWRIALKVGKTEEMLMIDRTLPNATRAGQGYLRSSSGVVTEFQAGYGGFPVQSEASAATEGFTIYQVEADGGFKPILKQTSNLVPVEKKAKGPIVKEEELIISILKQAAADLQIKSAGRIYLDPLPETIPLDEIFSKAGVKACYANGKWQPDQEASGLIAYWGEQDIPQECLQEILKTDFRERDGHLWIIGAQGSGKDIALTSLLLSIALTYTPDQVQFYMLEFGSGELAPLEMLPHTGAVIRPPNQERERLIRLLNFLDTEMDRRTSAGIVDDEHAAFAGPSMLVVINNYAELRANYQDETERLTRFIRDGKPVGIHLIITTNRGPELIRSVSNNISRRLVLQLGSRDEYLDIIGKQVPPLNENIPGRGYWVDGTPRECQVAQPPAKLRELMRGMREAWKGNLPKPIEILPDCMSLSCILDGILASRQVGNVLVPVGQSYETLEPVAPNLIESNPFWLILGPKESGKSNFLVCTAISVLRQEANDWMITGYTFRRSPLIALGQRESRIKVHSTAEDIIKDCQGMTEKLQAGQPIGNGKRLLLLVDDLGFSFQPGKEALLNALNTLAQNMESTTDVFILATGLLDELRIQLNSTFLKLLRQGRTGMVLSKDVNELDWLGAQISLEYRRMELPIGRGFFVNKGRAQMVQTPLQDGGK